MLREALAWWAKDNKGNGLLELLADCKEKYEEAKRKRQSPDKALSKCLKEQVLVPEYLEGLGLESSLAGLALHLDAYDLKKGDVIDTYRTRCTGETSEVPKRLNKAEMLLKFSEITPEDQLALLPPGSFGVSFSFQLRQPYISKDDTDFYVIDNPVKKDWVFKVPYIAPSQWKGCLHAAMVRQLADWWTAREVKQKDHEAEFIRRRVQLVRLFGNEQGVEVDSSELETYLDRIGGKEPAGKYRAELKKMAPEGHRRGRLTFYPTFFARLGVAVINPHSRKTGAGTFPIYFETVPEGTCGRFALLYVPFDRAGKDASETLREAAADLCRVAEGITFLLTEFGFGAKTASGFGLAAAELPSQGVVAVRLAGGEKGAVKTDRFKLLDGQGSEGLVKTAENLSQLLVQGGCNR